VELIEARQRALAAVGRLRAGNAAPAVAPRVVDREAALLAMKEAARARVLAVAGRLGRGAGEAGGEGREELAEGDVPAFLATTASAALSRDAQARERR